MIHLLNRFTGIAESGKRLSLVNTLDELWQVTFDLAERIFGITTAAVLLKDERDGALYIEAARGYRAEVVRSFRAGPGEGVTGYVLQTGEPQLVSETVNDPRYISGVAEAVAEMAVPLRLGEEIVGVLDTESVEQRFSTADLTLFVTFGEQVATSMRNLRLKSSLEERARRLVAVAKAGQSLTEIGDVYQLLDRILELVHEALRIDTSAIQLWDEEREKLVVIAARGYDRDVLGLQVGKGQGVTGRAAAEGRPIVVDDVREVPDYIPGLSDCRSEMAVPLIYQGRVVGVLNAEHARARHFDETDLLHATIFADQAASAITAARGAEDLQAVQEENERLASRLELVNRTASRLAGIAELPALLAEVLELSREALGFANVAVLLPEQNGRELRIHKAAGYGANVEGRRVPIAGSITGAAFESGETVFVSDVTKDARYVAGCPDGRCEVAVPLKVEDEVVGVLDAESASDELFVEDDVQVFELIATQVAVAVRNARLRAELAERARRLTLIHRAACSLNAEVDEPDELLETLLKVARKALGFDAVAILMPDPEGRHLVVRKALDHGNVEGLKVPLGEGFVGRIFVTGEAAVLGDVLEHEGYIPGTPGARCEMAVPIALEGETIGVLDAESRTPFAFSDLDLDLFKVFASQAATALRNSRLMHDLDEKSRRLTLIHRAACTLNTVRDSDGMLDAILKLARKAVELDAVAILLPDESGEQLVVRKALNYAGEVTGITVPVGQGVTGTVFATGEPRLVPDVTVEPGYIVSSSAARCEMAVPIAFDGRTIGVLDAEGLVPGAFSDADFELFRVFASQVATALNNARLIDELERRGRRLAALNRSARSLNSIHDLDAMMEEMLKLAMEALALERCALLLNDPEKGELVLHSAVGYGDVVGLRLPLGKGITGRVGLSGEPLLVADTALDDRYVSGRAGGRCEMAVPLRVFGEVLGVLDTESPRPGAFDNGDLELFAAFGAQAGVAVHNARLIRGLEEANRRLAENVAEMARLNQELESYAGQIAEANSSLKGQVMQLTALHEAGRTITSSLDLDTTLATILQMTSTIIGSTSGAIKLLDEESKEMRVRAESGKVSDISGSFSVLDLPLRIGDKTIGVFELVRQASQQLGEGERQMLETMASQAAIAIENARLFEDTQRVYYETLKSLAKALEARDDYTRGHSERVADLARGIARAFGLSDEEVITIYNAALLHDIGKIGIRDEVLLAKRRLSDDEMEIIRKHPSFGNTILLPLKFLGEIREFVRHHHERWDGTGYPDKRRGAEIPLASRIIAVADTFDAMTSNRPYRVALERTVAIDEIRRGAGAQFDPEVVSAFIKLVEP